MGRDDAHPPTRGGRGDFNPLSPHGERHKPLSRRWRTRAISIHSPRMGRDLAVSRWEHGQRISIHSPRMGRDLYQPGQRDGRSDFNPLSPHGERHQCRWSDRKGINFNPLSPHGERRPFRRPPPRRADFNPLSPHGERLAGAPESCGSVKFQSTLPAWGETIGQRFGRLLVLISIHSPRMGRDWSRSPCNLRPRHFNPLSPHGERLSARPARPPIRCYFNPLSPHGERHSKSLAQDVTRGISIHSPRMGRDRSRSLPRRRLS